MDQLFCSEGPHTETLGGIVTGSLTGPFVPPPPSSLGAVSDVTAAGVIGSGTHNTGIKHGILATQVSLSASPLTARERGGWDGAPFTLCTVAAGQAGTPGQCRHSSTRASNPPGLTSDGDSAGVLQKHRLP